MKILIKQDPFSNSSLTKKKNVVRKQKRKANKELGTLKKKEVKNLENVW